MELTMPLTSKLLQNRGTTDNLWTKYPCRGKMVSMVPWTLCGNIIPSHEYPFEFVYFRLFLSLIIWLFVIKYLTHLC